VRQIQAANETTFRAIAEALNDRGVHTARGGAWHDSTVRNFVEDAETLREQQNWRRKTDPGSPNI
jgi:hypothetical protein